MFEIQGNSNPTGSGYSSGSNETANNHKRENIAFDSTVINGMSHELRTQMNAIVSFAFLLKSGSVKESEKDDFINQIYFTCEQVISLFENYLESALTETGGQESEEAECNLSLIVENILSEFREVLRNGGKKNIEIVSETQYSGSTNIILNRNRVTRIIKCLFQNSIQNTNSGYIKIGYYSGSSNELTFYVLDSGQGFSKTREFLHTEDLADSLSQYQDLISLVNISLAKKLINQLNGSFSVKCNGTNGTGFYFTIPVKIPAKQNLTAQKYVKSMIAF